MAFSRMSSIFGDFSMKQKKTTKIVVLLTAEQKERISRAAEIHGSSMSTWLRQAAIIRLTYGK